MNIFRSDSDDDVPSQYGEHDPDEAMSDYSSDDDEYMPNGNLTRYQHSVLCDLQERLAAGTLLNGLNEQRSTTNADVYLGWSALDPQFDDLNQALEEYLKEVVASQPPKNPVSSQADPPW